MYSVNSEFLDALKNGNKQSLSCTINTKSGSTYVLSDNVILSCSIKTRVCDDKELIIGGVYLPELNLSFLNDRNDTSYQALQTLTGSTISVQFTLYKEDGKVLKTVPMGVFDIIDAKKSGDFYDIVGYSLSNLDKSYPGFPVTGTTYEILQRISQETGVEIASQTVFSALTNASRVITIDAQSKCNTWRDVLRVLSVLSCCNFYCMRTTHTLTARKIYQHNSQRNVDNDTVQSFNYADYTTIFNGLSLTSNAGTIERSQEGTGVVMTIKDAPFLDNLTDAQASNSVNNIWSNIKNISYIPCNANILADPTLDCWDKLTYVEHAGTVYEKSVDFYITSLTWKYRGFTSFTCAGKCPDVTIYDDQKISNERVAQRETNKGIEENNDILAKFNQILSNSLGFHEITDRHPDGSIVKYLADKPTLTESTNIFKIQADGFFFSNDGGKTYNSGWTSDGDAVFNILNAVGVQANWVKVADVDPETGKQVSLDVSLNGINQSITSATNTANASMTKANTVQDNLDAYERTMSQTLVETIQNLNFNNLFYYTDEPSIDSSKAPLIRMSGQKENTTSINSGNKLEHNTSPNTHGYLIRNSTGTYPFLRFTDFVSSPAAQNASMNGLVAGKKYTLIANYDARLYSTYTGTSSKLYLDAYLYYALKDSASFNNDLYMHIAEVNQGQKTNIGRVAWTFEVPANTVACYLMIRPSHTSTTVRYFGDTDYFQMYDMVLVEGESPIISWSPSVEQSRYEEQSIIKKFDNYSTTSVTNDRIRQEVGSSETTLKQYTDDAKADTISYIDETADTITLGVQDTFKNFTTNNLFYYTDEPSVNADTAPLIQIAGQEKNTTSVNDTNRLERNPSPLNHGYLIRSNGKFPFLRFSKHVASPTQDASMNGLVAGKTYTMVATYDYRLLSNYTDSATVYLNALLFYASSSDTSFHNKVFHIGEITPGVRTSLGRVAWKIEVPNDAVSCYIMIRPSNLSNDNYANNDYFQLADMLLLEGDTGIRAWSPSNSQAIAEIKITADEISQKVDKDGVISSINQSSEQVSINANKVNLTGYVTVKGVEDGTTTINGGCLTTGQIKSKDYNNPSDADFSNAGTLIDLDNGVIKTKDLFISGKETKFKGALEAATGSFSGSVTATQGEIGGWKINANELSGGSTTTNNYIKLQSSGTVQSSHSMTTGVTRYANMEGGLLKAQLHNTNAGVYQEVCVGHQNLAMSQTTTQEYPGIYLGNMDGTGRHTGGSAIYNLCTNNSPVLHLVSGLISQDTPYTVYSDRRRKKDIVPLNEDERWHTFFHLLTPVMFKYKDGTSGRTHLGFIAQDVIEAASIAGITEHELALVCDVLDLDGVTYYSLRYEEFIALNAHVTQYLHAKIETLENRIERLEKLIESIV